LSLLTARNTPERPAPATLGRRRCESDVLLS
jgi:hypothetical protein